MSSTTAEHEIPPEAGSHEAARHGFSDKQYVYVAMLLAALTAAEVSLSYMRGLGAWGTAALCVLMVLKFSLVVLYFMHLRFDAKIFSMLFWSGLILAVGVYAVALSCFQIFVR
jgi:cytochrome c oxidase subunit IV